MTVEAAPKPPKCKCLHMFMRFHMQVIVQSDLVYCDLLGVRLLWGAIETYTHHILTTSKRTWSCDSLCAAFCSLRSAASSLIWCFLGPSQGHCRMLADKAETHPIWPNACPDPRSMTPEWSRVSVFFLAYGSMTAAEGYLAHPSSNLRRQTGKFDPVWASAPSSLAHCINSKKHIWTQHHLSNQSFPSRTPWMETNEVADLSCRVLGP